MQEAARQGEAQGNVTLFDLLSIWNVDRYRKHVIPLFLFGSCCRRHFILHVDVVYLHSFPISIMKKVYKLFFLFIIFYLYSFTVKDNSKLTKDHPSAWHSCCVGHDHTDHHEVPATWGWPPSLQHESRRPRWCYIQSDRWFGWADPRTERGKATG